MDALLLTPLSPEASVKATGKIWTAANDGTVVVWADIAGTGSMDSSKAKVIKVEGGQCESKQRRRSNSWHICQQWHFC